MTEQNEITVGQVTIVRGKCGKWRLPGGEYTSSEKVALMVARRLDGMLK